MHNASMFLLEETTLILMVNKPKNMNDWGIRLAHFRDPDGNLIEINQPIVQES